MKLSDGEKIIISLLADLHKAMKIKGDLEIDRLMASIHGGHLWSLDWDYPGLLSAEEPEEGVVKQTCDVLDMWHVVEISFNALDAAGKEIVRAANFGHDPQFVGFDGNNERHFGVARHLIHDMGRFDHFKGRDLNSHSPSIGGYLRMWEAYEPIFRQLAASGNIEMSADQLASIFNAAYPAHGA